MASIGSVEFEMRSVSARGPYMPLSSGNSVPEIAETYRLRYQFYYLLFRRLCRWIVTLLFTGFIFLTLQLYKKKDNFSSAEKILFNTITTGLILGWGLNLFVSYNDAKVSARSPTDVG